MFNLASVWQSVCLSVCIGLLSNEEVIGVIVIFCLMPGCINYNRKKKALYS